MARELRPGGRYAPADVIPQSGPMCLIDAIADYGADWIETRVDVRVDGLFGSADGVPAWVGIEYMAQTVAAWSGIEQVQAGRKPDIGLLVGTRRCEFEADRFLPGWILHVRARLLLRDDTDLAVFDCSIRHGQKPLAQAQVKVYRPPDIRAFIAAPRRRGGS